MVKISSNKRRVRQEVATHSAAATDGYEHADGERFEITLPRLCGSRQAAVALVSATKVSLNSRTLVINARLVSVGTEAYADELLSLLTQRGVHKVELTPGPHDFEQHIARSAKLRRLDLTLLS